MSRFSENPMMHALILGLFAIAAAALLSSADLVTHGEIALRKQEDLARSLDMVIPAGLHDNNPLDDTLMSRDEQGRDRKIYLARKGANVSAVAFAFDQQGYGLINLIIGISANGEVLGVRVLKHEETPGLGDQIEAEKSPWIKSFDGRSLDNTTARQWAVKKDGGIFDQFSGATITPRAVVKGVVSALEYFKAHRDELLAAAPAGKAAKQGAGT